MVSLHRFVLLVLRTIKEKVRIFEFTNNGIKIFSQQLFNSQFYSENIFPRSVSCTSLFTLNDIRHATQEVSIAARPDLMDNY